MRIIKGSRELDDKKPIIAAEDDEDFDADFGSDMDEEEALTDAVDDVADTVEDMQDAIDDISEDSSNISVDNNIDDHYIAECESCKNIFISAVIHSEEEISHISGVCPICGKESDQYLKWIVKSVDSAPAPEEEQYE